MNVYMGKEKGNYKIKKAEYEYLIGKGKRKSKKGQGWTLKWKGKIKTERIKKGKDEHLCGKGNKIEKWRRWSMNG